MNRERTMALVLIGARTEIARLVNELGEHLNEFPELRKFARDEALRLWTTPEARTEKLIATKGKAGKRVFSDAHKKKIGEATSKNMKAFWKRRKQLAQALTDQQAADKAHAMPPVVSRSKRIGRPPKPPAAPPE